MTPLLSRRFGPLFAAQFLGAFNDNFYKNALVLLVLFHGLGHVEASGVVVNLAAGVFILPFFVLSASAGEWADRADKACIARFTKTLEVAIVALGGAGLVTGSLPLAMVALALLGVHSALFGPVKYGVLPQHLHAEELLAGNAWIEAATFLAILLGTLLAGVLVNSTDAALQVTVVSLFAALAGRLAVQWMPAAPPSAAISKLSDIDWQPLRATRRVLRWARAEPVWPVLLAISWFWAFGATVLTQLPVLVRDHLHGDAGVVSVLLAVFSVGVGAGSLLVSALLRRRPDASVVPLAALAMALSAGLWLVVVHLVAGDFATAPDRVMLVQDWLLQPWTPAVLLSLAALAVAGGAYCVPLYTALQRLAPLDRRGQAVAANNIVNSAAMVMAAAIGAVALASGVGVVALLGAVAALNLPVALWARRLPLQAKPDQV